MSLPPTRACAIARDPAQGPWARSKSRRNGARPRPEAGPSHGGPPSCAPARHPPPRANLPPRGFGPPLATRRLKMGATTMPPPQTRSARSCLARRGPASQDGTRASPKAIATGTRRAAPDTRVRPRWRPRPALTLPFATLRVCHSLGQARARDQGAGRPLLCCRSHPRLPKLLTPGYGGALGVVRWLRGKKGRPQQAQNCSGRQQGSLFPAPLHSTVWATMKNWTRQRRK